MPPGNAARASASPGPHRQLPAPRLARRGSAMTPLLDVRGLRKHYRVVKRGLIRGTFGRRQTGIVRAVDAVSFVLQAGQPLGPAGPDGCRKTPPPPSILDHAPAHPHQSPPPHTHPPPLPPPPPPPPPIPA